MGTSEKGFAMKNDRREAVYLRGRKALTPAQRRRMKKKAGQGKD